MRLGRIILAVLAPLVSLPALKADLAAGSPSRSDTLAGLLRAVVPMATVYAADNRQTARPQVPRVAPPVFTLFAIPQIADLRPAAAEAALGLLTRQQRRAQLRC